MSYPQAEAYIPKFLHYLLEKDVIKDYKLSKEEARNIFNNEFKSKYEVKGFSFSKMYSYLRYFKVIKCDKETETITFKADILNNITPDISIVKRKSFNIVKVLNEQQNEKPDPSVINVTSDSGIIKSENKKDNIRECYICNYTCLNNTTFKHHEKSKKHKLRILYNSIIKNLPTTHLHIFAEVTAGFGGANEDIVTHFDKTTTIILNLFNRTQFDFDIVEFIIINETDYVMPQEFKLPQILKTQSSFIIIIEVLFKETIYWMYPIVFNLKNRESGLEIQIFKELRIHTYSSAIEELRPVTPYNKSTLLNRSVTAAGRIIRGVHPKKSSNDFTPKFWLQQYRLPPNIIALLNAHFKEFDGITPQQRNILRDIKKLFNEYKKHNTLTVDHYYHMLELLLHLEEHQLWCNIKRYNVDNTILQPATYNQNMFLELNVPGLAEHRPSLLCGDSVLVSLQTQSGVKYEGVVHHVRQNSVLLKFCNSFRNKVHKNNNQYSISFTFNRVTLRAEHQAIRLIRQHNAIRVLFKKKIPVKKVKINIDIDWFNIHIKDNKMQQKAVLHILSKTAFPMPYVIFGPPGTGKTVVIVEAILQIWSSESKENILVCAPSNYAANEITNRLIGNVPSTDLLRYIAPTFSQTLINNEILPYINLKQNEYFHPSIEQIQSYRIVVTTLVTASRIINAGIKVNHFSYVFVDESCKATESETLIPIAGILTSSEKSGINGQIVLAGDPKQLGPIIHSSTAEMYGFGISMLERLMTTNPLYSNNENKQYNNNLTIKLVKSYRSHPAIIGLSNKLFYDNELESIGNKESTHLFLEWKELPNPKFPVIFHSVFGKDEQEGSSPSYFNLNEIDVVVSYLEKLINRDIKGKIIQEEDIGIISPYRKQTEKFKKVFSMKKWENLSVGSVESYQGQEKLIIIISTIRSKPELIEEDIKYRLGFLKNPKRFNVALTRAKALLIVVGNPIILQYDPYWGAFIKYCRYNKACVGTSFHLKNTYDQFQNDPLIAQLSSKESFLAIKPSASPKNGDVEDGPDFSRGNI